MKSSKLDKPLVSEEELTNERHVEYGAEVIKKVVKATYNKIWKGLQKNKLI